MAEFENENLFYDSSVDKQLVITTEDGVVIDNTMIHQQEFELNESLCSSSELEFGSCEASYIKFRVSNVIDSLKSKYIDVSIYLNHESNKKLNLGRFRVYSDKPTADRSYRDIIAYDELYYVSNSDVSSWYNSLTFPMTIKDYRDSFFENVGIQQETTTLPNDSFSIGSSGISSKQINGSQIIQEICEFNGCFGHLSRDGIFKYVFIEPIQEGVYPSNNLYPSEDLYPSDVNGRTLPIARYISAKYEDYMVGKITKVQILNEKNVIVGSYGSGNNVLLINGNSLSTGVTDTTQLNSVAQAIYEKVCDITFRPVESEAIGNPCIEVGEVYVLNTTTEILFSYVLQRHLKGIQSLKDNYISSGYEEREDESDIIQDLQSSLATTNYNLDVTNTTLSGTIARVGTLEADHVSVGSLNAVSARVGSLEADHVSVGSFNALSATVDTINANYISASTVKADYMEVKNWTSSGYIKASKIDVDTITSKLSTSTSCTIPYLFVTKEAHILGHNAKWISVTINSKVYSLLSY